MANSNLNTGGLEEAKSYMMNKEIPQLFESMMTALMYKKPANHIQFLEECLEIAKVEPKVKWHSFLDPLPPIPKADGKIKSENFDNQNVMCVSTENNLIGLVGNGNPLPPILQNDTNKITEKSFQNQSDLDIKVEDKVKKVTEKIFDNHVIGVEDTPNIEDLPKDDNIAESEKEIEETSEVLSNRPWYADYTEREIDVSKITGKPVIFILGGPGSGKGTQCSKISTKYNFVHLSAGDLLRKEVDKESEIGIKIEKIMKEGQLVPQDVTICLLKTEMVENHTAKGFLIDGFPREIQQGNQFQRQVGLAQLLLNYDCPDEILVKRLLSRAIHSGRADDNEETIQKRINLFHEKTKPVIEHYHDIVATINANRDIEDIFAETCTAIDYRVLGKMEISLPVICVIGHLGPERRLQCTKLAEHFKLAQICLEDLLQEEAEKSNEVSDIIRKNLNENLLVPQDIVFHVLMQAFEKQQDGNGGIILNGFPLTQEQALQFENQFCEPRVVIYLDSTDEVLKSFVMKENPGKNEEEIAKNIGEFNTRTTPLLLYYQDKIKSIDATKPQEEIFLETSKLIEQVLELDVPKEEEIPDKAKEKEIVEEEVVPILEKTVGSYGHSNHIFKEEFNNKLVIVVVGGPNVGRHKKCERIAQEFGYAHIYTGDLLKAEIEAATERGDTIRSMIENGEYIPQSTILELISDAMIKGKDVDCFLLDGYPRTIQQAEQFQDEVTEPSLCVYFSTTSLKMNEILSYDESQQMKNKVQNFEEKSLPLVEYYRNKGILREISILETEEVCFETIKSIFNNIEEGRKMSQELVDKNIFFVLGGPGCGKGTQCAKIVEKYGFCHLSTGDLLREEVSAGTERAEQLKAIMENGDLVPQATVLQLLRDAMIKRKDCNGFLIDGYPRDVPQGEMFEKTVGKCKFILYFECSNGVMTERLLGRAKTSGRVDDNEETIKKRLKTFENQTMPVLDKFEERVKKINAERGVVEIFADVCTILDTL